MRTVLFASAALACVFGVPMALASKAAADAAPRCEATNLRVYFSRGSTVLDSFARQTLAAAQHNMSDCDYAEAHVAVDAGSETGRARGQAVLAALRDRHWDEAVVVPRGPVQAIASSSPEYVEVALTNYDMPTNAMPRAPGGVGA